MAQRLAAANVLSLSAFAAVSHTFVSLILQAVSVHFIKIAAVLAA